jgi:predicted DNA-binding protein
MTRDKKLKELCERTGKSKLYLNMIVFKLIKNGLTKDYYEALNCLEKITRRFYVSN